MDPIQDSPANKRQSREKERYDAAWWRNHGHMPASSFSLDELYAAFHHRQVAGDPAPDSGETRDVKGQILREGIESALKRLVAQVNEYDDDSGNAPQQLIFLRQIIGSLNETLLTAATAQDSCGTLWRDVLMENAPANTPVLTLRAGEHIAIATWERVGTVTGWHLGDGQTFLVKVSHWMPLSDLLALLPPSIRWRGALNAAARDSAG